MKETAKISAERQELLGELLSSLGLPISSLGLLEQALTHSSFAAENDGLVDFERLEFFGDSVLKFVVSEYLFKHFAELDEGELTEIRAVLVSDRTLEKVGRSFELERYILVGRGVAVRESIVARSMEALLGAIYFDSQFQYVSHFIVEHFCASALEISRDSVKENYKAQLQQLTQGRAQGTPIYSVQDVQGPPHDPLFNVAVLVGNKIIADGSGRSKKTAEQAAARAAVEKLKDEPG